MTNTTIQDFISTSAEKSAQIDAAFSKFGIAIESFFKSDDCVPDIILGLFAATMFGLFLWGFIGFLWYVIDMCIFGPEIIISTPDPRLRINQFDYHAEVLYAKEEAKRAGESILKLDEIPVQDRDEYGNLTKTLSPYDQRRNKAFVPYIFEQNPKSMSFYKHNLRISKLWNCLQTAEQMHAPSVEYVYRRDPIYTFRSGDAEMV